MKKNKKLLVIGNPNQMGLFQLYGAETFAIQGETTMNEAIKHIEQNMSRYGIILISAQLFTGDKMIKKLRSLGIPVLPIPTHRSEANVALKNMEHMVTKAVGMSLDFLK